MFLQESDYFKGIKSLPKKTLIFYSYKFAIQCRRTQIFQSISVGLKYQRFIRLEKYRDDKVLVSGKDSIPFYILT